MGVDYYAYTVIGLKIIEGDLNVEKTYEYKLCKCANNLPKYKYCPDCSTLNKFGTYTITECIDNFSREYCNDYYGILTINDTKYKIFQLNDDEYLYITIHYSCHDEENKCPLTLETLCELKQKMVEDLKTTKFYKDFDKKFGIYTLLRCSY